MLAWLKQAAKSRSKRGNLSPHPPQTPCPRPPIRAISTRTSYRRSGHTRQWRPMRAPLRFCSHGSRRSLNCRSRRPRRPQSSRNPPRPTRLPPSAPHGPRSSPHPTRVLPCCALLLLANRRPDSARGQTSYEKAQGGRKHSQARHWRRRR